VHPGWRPAGFGGLAVGVCVRRKACCVTVSRPYSAGKNLANTISMRTKTSKSNGQVSDGPFRSVDEALTSVKADQWRNLQALADRLLLRLRTRPAMARYLAGVSGQEIVGSAVLALHLGAIARTGGRKVRTQDLENADAFLGCLRQVVRSLVDNFRRHSAAKVQHVPIGLNESEGFVDPEDTKDFAKQVVIRDVLQVLLPRVFQDVKDKPAQLAVVRACVESLGNDAMLPSAGQSKFVVHCVRLILRQHLKQLARELGIKNPTGKEMLL
jgi:hypothetical protein